MNSDILSAKRLKRKYERIWHRDNCATAVDIVRLLTATIFYLKCLDELRHYSAVVAQNNGNPNALWNTLKKNPT